MAENKETRDLAITDDLKPILSVLKEEDAQAVVALKEELTDTWIVAPRHPRAAISRPAATALDQAHWKL